MKSTVYLLTGSNLGDKKSYLDNAKQCLCRSIGDLLTESSVYESEPWGFVSENTFLNQVLMYETSLTPNEILQTIKTIEAETGRIHTKGGYLSRNLDIDILFYDNITLNSIDLTIPHPLLHKRRFTLLPLSEIAPNLIHPVLNMSVNELLEKCEDENVVNFNQNLFPVCPVKTCNDTTNENTKPSS
ncbi:MAG: 2-amino-4-hydroxy-6-hydroxymethyldihydropteridine diphosphokinase [Prevotellaceae bacterium]|jgi:2-amino-4-hydroxy-6-hydroxymethyldihydropteridine diphosphokinase|nr:2-amino-4-hydroxy-6-hydroxymethyldihydropteridine diphosphokinase [Prevotellaceae bacterium]